MGQRRTVIVEYDEAEAEALLALGRLGLAVAKLSQSPEYDPGAQALAKLRIGIDMERLPGGVLHQPGPSSTTVVPIHGQTTVEEMLAASEKDDDHPAA